MYIEEKLASLRLPDFKSREEMLETLRREEYGFPPPAPSKIEVVSDEITVPRFNAGKAPLHTVQLKCTLPQGEFTFPFTYAVPERIEGKRPAVVHISFIDQYHRYQPTEEILDRGFAVFTFLYGDITPDCDDGFLEGLGGVLFKDGKRSPTDPGKIAMWSWAASRIRDFIETLDCIDQSRVSVVGHSRLGKTALLTVAQDPRFFCGFTSAAGTSGDAISRGKQGETIDDICRVFPYWFCENYQSWRNREFEMPFDQHWLMACASPRHVYVASASHDLWADPEYQHLCCCAAGKAFPNGFKTPDRAPEIGDYFAEGDIGFHLRWGDHFLCREDWNYFLDFISSKA